MTAMGVLAAIAFGVSALELLVVRRAYAATFGRGVTALALLQLAAAATLWLDAPEPAIAAFVATLAIAYRSRGSYNGGSDSMLLVVALGLAIARLGSPRVGYGYIALQLALSYVLAGVAKLRDRGWRAGTALPLIVALPHYGVPPRLASLLARARLAGYAMLAFELTFPLAFVAPRPYAVVAIAFHLANAASFGLNRFLWAWLAAWPAVFYFAG